MSGVDLLWRSGGAKNGRSFKTCGGHTLKKQGRPQETIQCLQKALGVTWWQPAEDLGLGYTPVGDLLVQEEGWLTPPSLPPSTRLLQLSAFHQHLHQQSSATTTAAAAAVSEVQRPADWKVVA